LTLILQKTEGLTPPFSASRSSGKKKLMNHNIIGLVSMDLSKAFDSLPHDLIVEKLRVYGADDNISQTDVNELD